MDRHLVYCSAYYGGDMFLRNVSLLSTGYKALHPRRSTGELTEYFLQGCERRVEVLVDLFLRFLFDPEDRNSTFLRNVCGLSDNRKQFRIQNS
jgi:hypothetical protein